MYVNCPPFRHFVKAHSKQPVILWGLTTCDACWTRLSSVIESLSTDSLPNIPGSSANSCVMSQPSRQLLNAKLRHHNQVSPTKFLHYWIQTLHKHTLIPLLRQRLKILTPSWSTQPPFNQSWWDVTDLVHFRVHISQDPHLSPCRHLHDLHPLVCLPRPPAPLWAPKRPCLHLYPGLAYWQQAGPLNTMPLGAKLWTSV